MSSRTGMALLQIHRERLRQNELKRQGRFKYTMADPEVSDAERLTVLVEEVGEVAHEVNETIGGHRPLDREALFKELTQVAAICTAWLEALA